MIDKTFNGRMRKAPLALVGNGMLWSGACTAELQRAAAEIINVATDRILQEDDDVSFGDWLASELED